MVALRPSLMSTYEDYCMNDIRVKYITHAGTDKLVADVARVSFANTQFDPLNEASEKDVGLINYLARGLKTSEYDAILTSLQEATDRTQVAKLYDQIRNTATHFTPFCHTSITVQCTAPLPIRTQAFKHKIGFVENEESRRYITSTPELYLPESIRAKAVDVKQGSAGEHANSDAWKTRYIVQSKKAIQLYEEMIIAGICPEQARLVLPQGCMVNWVWTGNVMSFANMFNKRIDPHAQKEVQDLASAIQEVVEPLFPISWKALTRKDLGA